MTDQQSHSSRSQAGTSGALAHAVGGARADVEHLLAAFLADPGGEAGQMTRTMLFNYMLKQQTQQDEQTLRELDEHKAKWPRPLVGVDLRTVPFLSCSHYELREMP